MKRACIIALLALFLGAIFNQGYLWQHAFAPEGRVTAPLQSSRTLLGDEYYYNIVSKKSVLRLDSLRTHEISPESFFAKNSGLENIYSGALLTAGLFDAVAQIVPVSWPLKSVISFILQASFLMAGLMTAYVVLRRNEPVRWIEVLLFSFAWCFFNSGFMYTSYNGNFFAFFGSRAISQYPDILRLVNPQMGWAYALFYTALLVTYFSSPTVKKYIALVCMSLFIGVFSIPLTIMFIIGLGLTGLTTLIGQKKLDMPLLGIGFALLASFFYAYYQMHLFHLTEKGQELGTGSFIGVNIHFHYLLLLFFLPLIRKYMPEQVRSPVTWLYVAALLVGCLNQSFELGSRLWLRGAGAFAWLMIAYSVSEWLRLKFQDQWQKLISRFYAAPLLAGVIVMITFIALDIKFDNWRGYIEQEKAEIVAWLRDHATRDDVILSADLEDAYMIPLYTRSQPYVQLFDYGVLQPTEAVQHYFRALDLVGLKAAYLPRILSYTAEKNATDALGLAKPTEGRMPYEAYQTYAFYGMILYYPYTASTRDIFKSDEDTKAFREGIDSLAENAHASAIKKIDYIILKKGVGMTAPAGYTPRFENALYQILAPEKGKS